MSLSISLKKTVYVNINKFTFRVKLLQESYKLMEMKKLLRGYGIREVNLLSKEIMVSTIIESFNAFAPLPEQHGKFNQILYSLRLIELGSSPLPFC